MTSDSRDWLSARQLCANQPLARAKYLKFEFISKAELSCRQAARSCLAFSLVESAIFCHSKPRL